jgi:UDP-N-acetylmuramate--alanine ligase
MNTLSAMQSIYFLGIGGIGMSALARYFHAMGMHIAGYDKTATTLTRQLEKEGMRITYEEDTPLPAELDLVVYTPAIPSSHPAFAAIQQRGIPLKKRAEVLGMISRDRPCIAVAGTHGKTTTSAILSHLLWSAGMPCSAFLGGISSGYGTNYMQGTSEWVLAEADEYDRSFLHLHPSLLIINALDPDHLDIYGSAEQMLDTYTQLMRQIRPGGTLLYRADLPIPQDIKERKDISVYSFGEERGDFAVYNLRYEAGWNTFDLRRGDQVLEDLRFGMPGVHNTLNAVASMASGLLLGLDVQALITGLSTFEGVDRRFRIHFDEGGLTYVDDYAHHPVEVEGLIQAARSRFPGRRLTGIFQPHLYTRTRDFGEAFARVLDQLDEPVITDIYPAREVAIPGIDAAWLLSMMRHPLKRYVPRSQILEFLDGTTPDVLLTIGAGDVDGMIPEIVQCLKTKKREL